MHFLRQSTGVDVRIGPAVDATDGVTPETTLALGTADQAELLKEDGAATVDISAATFAAVTGCDGWYDLTLTTSHTDTLGQLTIVVQDSSLMLPIFKDFQVLDLDAYDAIFGVIGNGVGIGANVTALTGSTANAAKFNASASSIIQGTVDTVSFTATATEFEADNITESTASHYNGRIIIFTTGVLAGQAKDITAYSLSGANGHFTVTALTEAPGNNDTFVIV